MTIYWEIIRKGMGKPVIGFWRKPDKSDIMKTPVADLGETEIRKVIKKMIGLQTFALQEVKPQ